jgi:hypothetical protein
LFAYFQYVIDTCSPFKVTIQTLQEDEPALVSIIKPLHTQLVANYLQVKPDDNESVRKFKNLLESGLANTFDIEDENRNLEMSAFLDLRFKMINFMDDTLRKEVEQKVCPAGKNNYELIISSFIENKLVVECCVIFIKLTWITTVVKYLQKSHPTNSSLIIFLIFVYKTATSTHRKNCKFGCSLCY